MVQRTEFRVQRSEFREQIVEKSESLVQNVVGVISETISENLREPIFILLFFVSIPPQPS